MPPDVDILEKVTPEYRTLPGWMAPTSSLKDPAALPAPAREYLKFISESLSVEVGMISTGPEREATFVLPGTKLASWL